MKFEWDERKNKSNIYKHGISFNEAKEIFNRKDIYTFFDLRSHEEDREISIGPLSNLILITVVHTTRFDKIRIISARKATKKERKRYYAYIRGKT
jgi:uncharacterized DUF497 family protein